MSQSNYGVTLKRGGQDDNISLTIRRLKTLFSGFSRKFDGWGSAEKEDYRELLSPLNDLPNYMVRAGLDELRKVFMGRDEPHVEVIIKMLASNRVEEHQKPPYRDDPRLAMEYSEALYRASSRCREVSIEGHKDMQRLRVLLARDQLRHLNGSNYVFKPACTLYGHR